MAILKYQNRGHTCNIDRKPENLLKTSLAILEIDQTKNEKCTKSEKLQGSKLKHGGLVITEEIVFVRNYKHSTS